MKAETTLTAERRSPSTPLGKSLTTIRRFFPDNETGPVFGKMSHNELVSAAKNLVDATFAVTNDSPLRERDLLILKSDPKRVISSSLQVMETTYAVAHHPRTANKLVMTLALELAVIEGRQPGKMFQQTVLPFKIESGPVARVSPTKTAADFASDLATATESTIHGHLKALNARLENGKGPFMGQHTGQLFHEVAVAYSKFKGNIEVAELCRNIYVYRDMYL